MWNRASPRRASQPLLQRMDTTTSGGRLVFHVFTALAEFIRELIVEVPRKAWPPPRPRPRLGRPAARPPAMAPSRSATPVPCSPQPDRTISSIAQLLDVSRATIRKYVRRSLQQACHPTNGPCPTSPRTTHCCLLIDCARRLRKTHSGGLIRVESGDGRSSSGRRLTYGPCPARPATPGLMADMADMADYLRSPWR